VLFPKDTLEAIGEGRVTVAFRRWKRPTVRAGGRLRTAVGVLAIRAVEPIEPQAITAADARKAGFDHRDDLLAFIAKKTEGRLYRVTFELAGEDPRIALRNDDVLSPTDTDAIDARLSRMDARSARGPWTIATLEAIDRHPGVRAGDLAAQFETERLPFKTDVRKLKELGLTESLTTGYRLSPRGRAYLDSTTLRRR
jgi:hypothetical protein